MSKKVYTVSDLFFSSWRELNPQLQAQVFAMQQHALQLDKSTTEYGVVLISILRAIRKRWRLVDKLDEEQAVDCYNDLKFLNDPWYYFPSLKSLISPDEHMKRASFDHFIYADNEYSLYVATQDIKYLYRLVATIYRRPKDLHFDKEVVDVRAKAIEKKVHEWQLLLVFYTFTHIRAFVNKRCPGLLPSRKHVEGEISVTNTGPMWKKIKHMAAETKVFGTFEETGRANMYDVLDHLEILTQRK
jgi:hypothetical protein